MNGGRSAKHTLDRVGMKMGSEIEYLTMEDEMANEMQITLWTWNKLE